MSSPTESFSDSPPNRSRSAPGSPSRDELSDPPPHRPNDATFNDMPSNSFNVFSNINFPPHQPNPNLPDVRDEIPSVLYRLTNEPAFTPSTLPSGLDNLPIDPAQFDSYPVNLRFRTQDLNLYVDTSGFTTDDRNLNPLSAASLTEDHVAPDAFIDDFAGESIIHRSLDSPSSRLPDSSLRSTTPATSQPQALSLYDFVSPSRKSQIVEDEQQLKLTSATDCSQVEVKEANR
jgi:hypothetical protein